MPPTRSEIGEPEAWNILQFLNLVPEFRFRSRIKDVKAKLAELFEGCPGFEFIHDGKRIQLPHRRFCPVSRERHLELAVSYRYFIFRQPEISLQPPQEVGFENPAPSIKRVARQPDQLRPSKAQAPGVLHLCRQFFDRKHLCQAHLGRAIAHGQRDSGLGVVLPDELQHQELVEVGVEQRPGDRVEFPVVVMGAACKVHNHSGISSTPTLREVKP